MIPIFKKKKKRVWYQESFENLISPPFPPWNTKLLSDPPELFRLKGCGFQANIPKWKLTPMNEMVTSFFMYSFPQEIPNNFSISLFITKDHFSKPFSTLSPPSLKIDIGHLLDSSTTIQSLDKIPISVNQLTTFLVLGKKSTTSPPIFDSDNDYTTSPLPLSNPFVPYFC